MLFQSLLENACIILALYKYYLYLKRIINQKSMRETMDIIKLDLDKIAQILPVVSHKIYWSDDYTVLGYKYAQQNMQSYQSSGKKNLSVLSVMFSKS